MDYNQVTYHFSQLTNISQVIKAVFDQIFGMIGKGHKLVKYYIYRFLIVDLQEEPRDPE